MIKENEKIRRLEQSNYALKEETKKLRERIKKNNEEDIRDEIIEHMKLDIDKLKEENEKLQKELNAYEKLYEDESKTTDKLIQIIKTFSSLF
jgi:hypothetical protein